jgi:Pro-Pro endopeptidase
MELRRIWVSTLILVLFLANVNVREMVSAETLAASAYNDYQAEQYWAEPFEWGVDAGLIKGYVNAAHPLTKKTGNWLNPNGKLTESQYLAMLFRYLAPANLSTHEKAMTPGQPWDTGIYSLAKSLAIPVKNLHGQQIRRGDTALILASGVTGMSMTEKQAVQWLYDHGVSSGYVDTNGNYPKTYESFKPNEHLTRAQGITFLHRFSTTDLPKSLKKVEIALQQVLDQLITFPAERYDQTEALKIVDRISQINRGYLEALVRKEMEVRLINRPLTEEPEYKHLKGVVPRGWEGTGNTWDDIPGVGGGSPTIVRIGYSDYGKGHGTLNLELHEIAHTIDFQVFSTISASAEFKDIQKKEARLLIEAHPNAANMAYFTNYPEEYFAESFTYYYLSTETKKELQQKAPLTYQFFEKLEKRKL